MTGQTSAMKIIKPGAKPSNEAPSEYFTGAVRVTPLVKGESPSYLTCASGGFQPGARSAWHTHPKGQLLALAGWCHPLRRSGIMATRRLFRHRSEARVKLVRAEGLEPSRTLRSNGFSYLLRLSPPPTAFAMGFGVWTIPSPCPDLAPGVRCCPSSLYTFPAVSGRAWLGIAMVQGSPTLSSSTPPVSRRALKFFRLSPMRLPISPRPHAFKA